MEIRHLKLIKAVAESKSLTKAADILYLSQSALSHQLREIESHYQTNFFSRLKKEMILTPAGERFLQTANKILEELNKNDSDIRHMVDGNNATLRLSTECFTCYYWIFSFLKKYHEKFPGVEVEIIAEATRRPIQCMEQGKLDVAMVSGKAEDETNINYHKLFSDELVAVVPPSHPWAKLRYVTPEHFRDETVIIYSLTDEQSTLISEILKPAGVYPKKVLRIELTEAIIEMVKAGFGVSMFAKWAVSTYISKKEVVAVPIGKGGLKRNWYAATLKQSQPGYIKSFIEMLEKDQNNVFKNS